MSRPRFELVVRVVRDNPEKNSFPQGRDVLHEEAVALNVTWVTEPITSELILCASEDDIRLGIAKPLLEAIKAAPFEGMVLNCLDQMAKRFPLKTEIKGV